MVGLFIKSTLYNTASSAASHIPLYQQDAGIEPRTVKRVVLVVRRCIHLARSFPQHG